MPPVIRKKKFGLSKDTCVNAFGVGKQESFVKVSTPVKMLLVRRKRRFGLSKDHCKDNFGGKTEKFWLVRMPSGLV